MQLPPLSVIANYPTPNYVNPETRGPSLLIANCVMLSISLVVVGIRFYTRIFISRCFGPDDFFILLALVCLMLLFPFCGAKVVLDMDIRCCWHVSQFIYRIWRKPPCLGYCTQHHPKATSLFVSNSDRLRSGRYLCQDFDAPSHAQNHGKWQ